MDTTWASDHYRLLLRLTYGLPVAGFIILGCGFIWLFRARLPREIRSRYPKRVVVMSGLPLTEEWRLSIAQEDLPAFVRARRGLHVFLIASFIKLYLVSSGYYVLSLADALACHMGVIGVRIP